MKENNYKKEFYRRLYRDALKIIKFVEKLPKDSASRILGEQLIRSGTSVASNPVEAKSASSKKEANEMLKETMEIANILAASILTMKGKK